MVATPEQIQAIQDLLPDDREEYGWDENRISTEIESGASNDAILAAYWNKVMASTANLVDMSESGSSRSLSQIHKNAATLAKLYGDRANPVTPPVHDRRGMFSRTMRRV